jgi:hypothetical protein
MKHVGKMKNNNARIVVVYRTLPGDAYSALVVGTGRLGETYHDALMNIVQEPSGQQANELADILSVRQFPDGSNMLEWLHTRGHLKKVPTNGVLMTPTAQSSISLDELNQLIAEQKGVALEDLAINDGSKPKTAKKAEPTVEPAVVEEEKPAETMNASELRSKADALFKQAQQLRKKADEMDPPKSKIKKVSAEAE